jgi:hypothetical protein
MFHKHRWVEVERISTGPVAGITKLRFYDDSMFDKVMYGMTIITYKCECGRRTQDQLVGRVTK